MADPTEIVIPVAMAIQFGAACFMAGQFAQRLKRVEDENKDRASFNEKVTRLDERIDTITKNGASTARSIESINRQLGNLMTTRTAQILSADPD